MSQVGRGRAFETKGIGEPVSKPLAAPPKPCHLSLQPHPSPWPLSTQFSSPQPQNVLCCVISLAFWPYYSLCLEGHFPLLHPANSCMVLLLERWNVVLFLEEKRCNHLTPSGCLSHYLPHLIVSILGAKTLLFTSGSLATTLAAQ